MRLITDVTLDKLYLIARPFPREVVEVSKLKIIQHYDGSPTATKSLGNL